MPTNVIAATVTLAKRYGDRREFRATAQLAKLDGNAHPHFSVVGEDLNLRRRGDNRIEAAGQMHDEVVEHFPKLAPVTLLHLSDDHGRPMYAVENGGYWLGLGDPRYVPEGAPHFDKFARLWRIDEATAREIHLYAETDGNATEALKFCARDHEARWQAEADAALATIRRLAADSSHRYKGGTDG